MKRRKVLAGLAVLGAATGAGGFAGATFRWHARPSRYPALMEAHLRGLTKLGAGRARVLFVGNSMVLHHDLPDLVAARAGEAGYSIQVAMAAARGARLIETWSVADFRATLRAGWDILVLQDFSTTALRAPDRWGSAFAMRAMAREAQAKGVLLYPTWAFPPGHGVYHGQAGFLARRPSDPAAFADLITSHYARIARAEGWVRAPVTEAMLPDATPWLADDLHHLNRQGADKVARIVWESLQELLVRVSP